jgi:hypothetical protein
MRAFEEPPGLLDRFRARMRVELERLPDYVCTQTIERFNRSSSEERWQKVDTLRFEVALVGNQELYAEPGARQFQSRPLAEMVGRGTISTGQLALFAKHVFLPSNVHFTYRGENEQAGRPAHQYDYDVAPERSSYRLRFGAAESTVGFQGAFWIDPPTLDLVRLEVQAYDLPQSLGLAEANTTLNYARVAIDNTEILLPVSAAHSLAALKDFESLNRMELSGCRHYRTEAAIRYDDKNTAPSDEEVARNRSADVTEFILPKGTPLDLALNSNVDLTTTKIGDRFTARTVRPVKDGERIVVPEGSTVLGHVVRLEKQSMPLPIYEIGLQFDVMQLGDRELPLVATMENAGPAAGLLRQAKRLDPKFTKQRTARMDILVREVQHGQGILHWDARRSSIPRGLRMKWRIESIGEGASTVAPGPQ